jgi:prevent-host-death family protein
MTIVMQTMSASVFKARCLAVLDEVASTGEAVVITKRGRAVARLVPAQEPASLRGSITYHVSDEELISPIDVPWDAERE